MIDFSLVFNEVNVAQSHALQFCLRTVLRSLVENSVVRATGALIDDARKQVWEREQRGGEIGLPLLLGRADANDAFAFPKNVQQQQGLLSAL